MNQKEILKFNEAVISVFQLIEKALEQDKANVDKIQLPNNYSETQAIVRPFAEDLMLCVSVDEAINRLRQDPKAALTALCASTSLTPETSMKLIRLAHAKTSADFSTLPCLPLASYLIELCDRFRKTKINLKNFDFTPIKPSQTDMPKAKLKTAPWKPSWWPDWKNEPLKFTFSPDEALKRAAYVKLPKIAKSSRKSR